MDKFPNSKKIDGFDDIRVILENIPCIGHGGCGVSAIAMFRWLISKGFPQVNLSFLMGYNQHNSYLNNSQAYANEVDLPNSCSHVALVIQYEDNDLILDYSKRLHVNSYLYSQIVDEEALISSLNTNPYEWNTEFDRQKYIPIIAKKLKINLSDIKLN